MFARNITWRWPLQCAGSVWLSDAATTYDVMTSRRQTQWTTMCCECIPWRNVSRRRVLQSAEESGYLSFFNLKTKWPLKSRFPSKWWYVINRKRHSCVFGVKISHVLFLAWERQSTCGLVPAVSCLSRSRKARATLYTTDETLWGRFSQFHYFAVTAVFVCRQNSFWDGVMLITEAIVAI
jgi:hypothetical protein